MVSLTNLAAQTVSSASRESGATNRALANCPFLGHCWNDFEHCSLPQYCVRVTPHSAGKYTSHGIFVSAGPFDEFPSCTLCSHKNVELVLLFVLNNNFSC